MNQTFTLLVGLFFLLYSSSSWAQCSCTAGIGDQNALELYWTGSNSNNYNDICNWRLNGVAGTEVPCQAPRSADNVYFMDASFAGTVNTVNIDQNSNCRNMTWDNTIPATKNLRMTGASSGTLLDVYGNLEMATNMNVAGFIGKLRFTATQAGVSTFLSRGLNFRLYDLEISLGANAELRLLDDLTVNNRSNNNVRRDEGGITLQSGHFNTNGQTVRADRFYTRNNNTTRRITIDNSTIILDGNLYINSGWNINFNATNNAGLSTTGSHIILEGNFTNSTTIQYYSFGTATTYDSITLSKEMGRHVINPVSNFNCHYLEIADNMLPLDWRNSTITTDYFKVGKGVHTYNLRLNTDNFIGPSACNTALLEIVRLGKKTAGGNLAINNVLAIAVTGNAGSTYSATSSYEGAGCSAITFAPVTTCNNDLRFTGASGNDWGDVGNWVNHVTGTPATHIPTPWSNVYFTGSSFTSINNVLVSEPAFCKDMRWQGVTPGSDLRLGRQIFLNGTLELDPNMAPINEGRFGHEYGRGFICLSPDNDSIISNGVYVASSFHFMNHSRYDIVDTLHTSMLQQRGGNSYLTINNANLQINNYLLYTNSTWTNATVNYTGGGWTGVATGGTQIYTNSTFYFNNTSRTMVNATLPNVVIQGTGKTFPHSRIDVRGDLRVNTSSLSSMKDAYNYTSAGRILVSGDMYVAAGIDIMLNSNAGSYVRVQGDVYTSGNCSAGMTSIRTDVGDPVEFTVNGLTSNIQDVYLQALDASLGQPLVAVNSTDGGNNSNITFSLGTGRTFYWVADLNGSPTDFDGNWSNPDHWTTIPTSTVGDGTCIPTIVDNVIFTHPTSRCIIDGSAYCNNLDAQVAVTFGSVNTNNNWYIGGDWTTAAGTINNFYGRLNFVGNIGDITSNGVSFNCKEMMFNKVGGTWTLQDDFRMDRLTTDVYANHMILAAGTLNSNGHDVFVRNRFTSTSNNIRSLQLDNSTFTIGGYANYNDYPRALWNTSNSANMTINGGLVHIQSLRNSNRKSIHFGDGNLQYDSVLVEANDYEMLVYGTTNFNYAEWNADLLVRGSNSYDTLVFNGGHTYRFLPNLTQTLNAPHGKLKSKNVGPASFINLETNSVGQPAYIFKEYGQSFCLNYIKVKDVRATKATTQPAACTLPDCWSLLEFQTDQNSDSISIANSDWGVWRFKLAPLVNPVSFGADTIIICKTGANLSYPIQITGTSPYIIDYSWQDANNPATNGGQSGILVYDNDNNPNTPYIYNVPLNPVVNAFNYTVDIATTRCGERILSTPIQTHVIVPTPQPLVQTNRMGNCIFDNEGEWYSILDDVDDRPIVSLLDSITPTDDDSLGLVNVEVYFEPTVQTLTFNGDVYPYLQRHWQITPANNHGAKVRIYFTKAELDALGLNSFAAYNGGVNPATELLVLKYNDGTFPIATTAPNVTIVPHAVVAASAADWMANPTAGAPFSTTNNMIALEFEVGSFSHFAVVLTQSALLQMPNLQEFEAVAYENKQAKTSWVFDDVADVANFTVQHTTNHQIIHDKGDVAVVDGQLDYELIDPTPNLGINYYRLKSTQLDGSILYSEWKTVTFQSSMLVNLFPNPTSGNLFVQLHSEQSSGLDWQIINSVGQVVLEGTQDLQVGMQTFALPTTPLTSGFYSIRISHTATGFVQQHNFIKD